uniref:Uncharacterized protein n=1 Tax=Acrobeloides nanus TaxID=290746 RepID=A0A914DJ98_9BILA
MVEIVHGYVASVDVCMVTQIPRKYSFNYGIAPPPPSTSENYKNLIKFMCVEKSVGRVVQTVNKKKLRKTQVEIHSDPVMTARLNRKRTAGAIEDL